MGGRMTRSGYASVIADDIEWLKKHTPDTLTRSHIILVLEKSIEPDEVEGDKPVIVRQVGMIVVPNERIEQHLTAKGETVTRIVPGQMHVVGIDSRGDVVWGSSSPEPFDDEGRDALKRGIDLAMSAMRRRLGLASNRFDASDD